VAPKKKGSNKQWGYDDEEGAWSDGEEGMNEGYEENSEEEEEEEEEEE
jgi:hypothetical protein